MNKKIEKYIGYIFIALTLILGVIMIVIAAIIKIIPNRYIIVAGLLYVAGALIIWVITLLHNKWQWNILSAVIFAIYLVITIIGGSKMLFTKSALEKNMGVHTEITQVCVYVREGNKAETISDAADYKFGALKKLDEKNTKEAIAAIEKELGREINVTEYDDIISLADAMIENKIDAMIINDAYLPIIAEWNSFIEEGVSGVIENYNYEKFVNRLKKIYQYDIEKEIDNSNTVSEKPFNYVETDSFIMLISGQDVWGGVSGVGRSDVNIMAVVNAKTHKVLLVTTPRDYYVDLAGIGQKDKLTHAGVFGVTCSRDTLENLYGVDIEYFFKINFSGFEAIIDALDGITVYSDYDFTVEPIKHYTIGENKLTGLEALAFARERHAFKQGDFVRGENQMKVLTAVADKLASKAILANYSEVLDSLDGLYFTDMPYDVIASMIKDQLAYGEKWEITSYEVQGTAGNDVTYTSGATRSIVYPDEKSIAEAKKMIQDTLEGK